MESIITIKLESFVHDSEFFNVAHIDQCMQGIHFGIPYNYDYAPMHSKRNISFCAQCIGGLKQLHVVHAWDSRCIQNLVAVSQRYYQCSSQEQLVNETKAKMATISRDQQQSEGYSSKWIIWLVCKEPLMLRGKSIHLPHYFGVIKGRSQYMPHQAFSVEVMESGSCLKSFSHKL